MPRGERGVVLLDVLLALAIVGATGLAVLGVLGSGLRAEREAAARERTLAQAERVLAAYTLLLREELDRRLGRQSVGPVVVSVQRPERALYRIAVAEAASPHVEALVTVVYRPGGGDAP